MCSGACRAVAPGSFSAEESYYPRVLNAQIHPTVAGFLGLGNERIATRFAHLHPEVSKAALLEALAYKARFFRWAGADTFCVTDGTGRRQTVVIECNSSPSGCKSIPFASDADEQGAYRRLIEGTFLPMLRDAQRAAVLPPGGGGGGARAPAAAAAAAAKAARGGSIDSCTSVGSAASSSTYFAARSTSRFADDARSDSSLRLSELAAAAVAAPASASAASDAGSDDDARQEDADALRRASLALSVPPVGGEQPVPPLSPGAAGGGGGGGGGGGSATARQLPPHAAGVLAVVYDKNHMECGAYAATIADATGETVYLAEFFLTDPDPPVRFDGDRRMHVRSPAGGWLPVRGAFKYVTQRPWTRIPLSSATPCLNPILPCLAGGRNKMVAAQAYDDLNAELAARGKVRRQGGRGG